MKKLKFKSYIGLLLLSFSISPLCVMANMKMGAGNNIVEPYIILGLILLSYDDLLKSIFISCFTKRKVFYILYVLIFLFLIGLLRGEGNFPIVYADFRCHIVLLYAFLLFQQPLLFQWENGHIVKFFLWSSIFMDLTYSILTFQGIMAGITDNVRITSLSIINCVILLFLYILKWKDYNKALFIIMIMTYHVIVSAMRNFYIVYAVALLVYSFYLLKERGRMFQKVVIISLMVLAPILYWDSVMDFWMSDGSRSTHSVERVEQTFSGENTEVERTNSVLLPFEDPTYYIIPHGLGWRDFLGEIQHHYPGGIIWSTMDSQFYYMFFHYGSLLAMLLFLYLYGKSISNILHISQIRIVLLAIFALNTVALLTQGAAFTMLSFSCYYGILWSCAVSPYKNLLS